MKVTAPNGRPVTRLDSIKQSILLFMNAKLTINPDHRFAFAALGKSAFWMMTGRIIVLVCFAFLVSATFCSGTVLPLHRTHPPAHNGDLAVPLARDQARQRRIISNLSLYGSDSVFVAGLYYTKLHLGTPPREYSVEVDTGSDLLWVNCIACTGCPNTTDVGITLNFFDPGNSSTSSLARCSHRSRCTYSVRYGDGSLTTGYKVTDLLHLPSIMPGAYGISSQPVDFGCSTTRSGLFSVYPHAVDGILGLGHGSTSVVSQLQSQGVTPHVFSHCLNGGDTGGGFLVFGEVVDPQVVYTPLIRSKHYSVRLLSIDINGQLLPIDSERTETNGVPGIVVDSGTTFTYLLESDYHLFVAAINNAVSQFGAPEPHTDILCYVQTTSRLIEFPSIALHFEGGASMILRLQDYIIYTSSQPCMGFRIVPDQGFPVLGEISLKDKVVIYDLAQQRIGWINNYDCLGSYNVSTTYGFVPSTSCSKLDLFHKNKLFVIVTILLLLLI